MMIHSEIVAEFERLYTFLSDAELIGPGALAITAYRTFAPSEVEPHIEYASIEHFKSMARRFLARRSDPDSDDSEAYDQGDLFSGKLQDRYPLPRPSGEEPVYKLRSHLSTEERAWNVSSLRKSANARLKHADALEAEGLAEAA